MSVFGVYPEELPVMAEYLANLNNLNWGNNSTHLNKTKFSSSVIIKSVINFYKYFGNMNRNV